MARRYEGSPADRAEDRKGAKRAGIGLKAYERTAKDKAEDKAGQKRLAGKGRRR